MPNLLQIDTSAQVGERSLTRGLTDLFVRTYLENNPQARLTYRDLGADPPPFVDHRFIEAAFTAPAQRTTAMCEALSSSESYIEEVIAADLIVLGVPMYNYGMPATLKAWIDQVARLGRTFSFDLARGDFPIRPLLHGKQMVVLSSRGEFGFGPEGVRAERNALDPALAACAHYLGVEPQAIETVAIEYQEFKDARHARSVTAARARTIEIARAWAQKMTLKP